MFEILSEVSFLVDLVISGQLNRVTTLPVFSARFGPRNFRHRIWLFMDQSTLQSVETARKQLESRIASLKTSLKYWRTIELDYISLNEELDQLDEDARSDDILAAMSAAGAEQIDEKELKSIVGTDKGTRRSPKQIEDTVAKRIEYSSRNALTIRKQLQDLQTKLEASYEAQEDARQDATNTALPDAEISEELDNQGLVVSSSLKDPSAANSQIVDALEKVGIKDLSKDDATVRKSEGDMQSTLHDEASKDQPFRSEILTLDQAGRTNSMSPRNKVRRKSPKSKPEVPIRGNLATCTASEIQPSVPRDSKFQALFDSVERRPTDPTLPLTEARKADIKEEIMGDAAANEDHLDADSVISSHPDDTEGEAALRKEMVEYGLGEVGAIVAELDLEEGDSDFTGDDDDLLIGSESDYSDSDENEESEDDTGRVKKPVLSRKYIREMKALEKKLGITGMHNAGPHDGKRLGPETTSDRRPSAAEAARNAAIARAEAIAKQDDTAKSAVRSTKTKQKKPHKKVAFAEDLDIAPKSKPKTEIIESNDPASGPSPMSEIIIERPSKHDSSPPTPAPPTKKLSKFKQARLDAAAVELAREKENAAHKFAEGQLLHSNVHERANTDYAPPPDPDDFDSEMQRKQIQVEYQQLRNKMIQQQGGYVPDEDEEMEDEMYGPLMIKDPTTARVRKVSRFKAARMK